MMTDFSPVATAVHGSFTRSKYGARGLRYLHMEVGHAAKNVCLQAVALDLGCVVVGAFDDDAIKKVLRLTAIEEAWRMEKALGDVRLS